MLVVAKSTTWKRHLESKGKKLKVNVSNKCQLVVKAIFDQTFVQSELDIAPSISNAK